MLIKGKSIPRIYWALMIPIFLWIINTRIFSSSQWDRYGFSELEDFGLLLFDIVVCLAESFNYGLLIWLCVSVAKNLLGKNRVGTNSTSRR